MPTLDSLFPLQAALGYDIAQSLFIGPNNLTVSLTALGQEAQSEDTLAVRPSQVVPCERFQPLEWRLVVKGAVWLASIVEVEPAGEGEAPRLAVAVDGAVGPAAEQGADEALGFAVRARRRVGAAAQVV